MKLIRCLGLTRPLFAVVPLAHNRLVKCESLETPGKWFTGRVRSYDAIDAVIVHESDLRVTTVLQRRLELVPLPRGRYAGATG